LLLNVSLLRAAASAGCSPRPYRGATVRPSGSSRSVLWTPSDREIAMENPRSSNHFPYRVGHMASMLAVGQSVRGDRRSASQTVPQCHQTDAVKGPSCTRPGSRCAATR
jgi:hypothetical protein